MLRRANKRRPPADLSFNATPMIDCAMQLIIFFMLAGSFASMDNVALKAPEPTQSVAADLKLQHKAVVNILPFEEERIAADPALAGAARCYRLGTQELDPSQLERLTDELKTAAAAFEARKHIAKDEAFEVEIRADRTIDYRDVAPVMMAVSKAGIARMNITAVEQSRGM